MKINKILSFAFIGILTLSSSNQALAASFPDVVENTVNYNAVEYLKSKGIITGYTDGTFKPDKTINRAEALKIILLSSGLSTELTADVKFPDVISSEWYYKYVVSAYASQIIDGYPDGTFKPGNNINLAESLKIILLAFKSEISQNVSPAPFSDVKTTDWYIKYAATAKEKNLVWPQDNGSLNAGRDITRGEFAQIIYRLMYIKENSLEEFPINKDWPTYTHPSDHYTIKYPFGWKTLLAGSDLVVWKQDTANNQVSFGRVYPNGATMVISSDSNPGRIAFSDYVNGLPYFTNGVTQTMTLNNYPFANVTLNAKNIDDFFYQLPNSAIISIYSEVGSGANKAFLQEEVRESVSSLTYTESGSATTVVNEKEVFLSAIRAKVLVTGASDGAVNAFNDLILIETDSIGIGTGPIDYYYSAKYDTTLKIERNSKTLLAISAAKNTAF